MRAALLCVIPALLLGSACAKKTLALPDDPIERAATCGVVETARARQASTEIKGPLPFDEQGRILHYALLAASDGKEYDADRAKQVIKRMPLLADKVTSKKWQTLVVPCQAAYPETALPAPTLPADPLKAEFSCYMLDDFIRTALAAQEFAFADDLEPYRQLTHKLDLKIGSRLQDKGVAAGTETLTLRREALARAAKLGTPMEVMKACIAKYGDKRA